MNKIVVKSLVGQNGESLGSYVDYGDFCKMQSEYEEQIEKMKCCGNCKHFKYVCDLSEAKQYNCHTKGRMHWELAE